jgi:hypothetical protein
VIAWFTLALLLTAATGVVLCSGLLETISRLDGLAYKIICQLGSGCGPVLLHFLF